MKYDNKITRKKYMYYDAITGTILGIYNTLQESPHQNYIIAYDDLYDIYFEGITNGKQYKIIDDTLTEINDINNNISLDDYKALKNAKLVYESRVRSNLPFEYNGNYFDVYFLRNNYFDQRLIEEISNSKTNEIKLITINNRTVIMDIDEFIDFYHKYTQHNKAINDKLLELLDKVLDSNDRETIDTITWEDDINRIIYPKDSIFMPLTDNTNTYINKLKTIVIDEENIAKEILYTDAPHDDNVYARKNKEWVNITHMASMGFNVPPNDNKLYAMQNGKWVAIANLEVEYT